MSQTTQKMNNETTWKLIGTGSAVLASVLIKKGLMSTWQRVAKTNPPNNPAQPGAKWADAVAWAAGTGVFVGIARMIAARGAAAGWQRITGVLPPGVEKVS